MKRQNTGLRAVVLGALIAAMSPLGANAESIWQQLRDDDGWLDASDYVLNNAIGFMPVPLFITEPAVGEGLGLAALFFHPPKGYDEEEYRNAGKIDSLDDLNAEDFVLPNITAAAGAYTNNDSWFVGGGHFAYWKDDTVRYEGVIGYASVNLRFYGGPQDPPFLQDGIEFNGKGAFLDQPLSFRLGKSNFFLGGQYTLSTIETSTTLGDILPPEFPRLSFDATLSALGAFLRYDNRDTIFTPSKGTDAKITLKRNDNAIGSDFDFTQLTAFVHSYFPLHPKWVLGVRGKVDTVTGDTPFYVVPFIDMRGIPVLRYQGEATAVVETEARWAFHPRISTH